MKRFCIWCLLFGCEGYADDTCRECGGRVGDNPACGWGGIGD